MSCISYRQSATATDFGPANETEAHAEAEYAAEVGDVRDLRRLDVLDVAKRVGILQEREGPLVNDIVGCPRQCGDPVTLKKMLRTTRFSLA